MMSNDRKPRRPHISEEEHALWRGVTRWIAPLKRRHAAADAKPTKSGAARAAAAGTASPRAAPAAKKVALAVAPKGAPQKVVTHKSAPPLVPLERRLKQRVGRGTEPVDARLDLHGQTQELAYMALLQFLRNAQSANYKIVLVVTGKGRTATGDFAERGVLRRLLPQWLRLAEFRGYVVGFEDAPVRYGSSGAQLIRVRRNRRHP
jgi:DNA-nicking Smr family endonuclease